MHVSFLLEPDRLILAGYIVVVIFLNITMYLISVFYKKKLGRNSPRLGFVVAVLLSACYALTVFVSAGHSQNIKMIQSLMLIIAGCASIAGSVGLFLTMRKPRK